jgi:hypothetical protein
MPPLANPLRAEVWIDWMKRISASREAIPNLTKTDLRAAINATDDWLDANATSFNQALPLAARTNLTPAQKALLLALVTLKRFA